MFRRSASSLLLAGLLFADGSWFARLEGLFAGLLGGRSQPQASWSHSVCDCGGTIDPNGQPTLANGTQDSPEDSQTKKPVNLAPEG